MLFLASFVAETFKLHLQMQLKIENTNQTSPPSPPAEWQLNNGCRLDLPPLLGGLLEQKYQGGRTSCVSKFSLLQLQSPPSPPPCYVTEVFVWPQQE